ncbi:MAG: PASTA domain-containing protein [Actinomycetia bacterium]|nr:PASTA domain-containing protein [Actinomycetes bacterium]
MKRTISSVLALAMVAALLAIFAGAANAQTDEGKAQLTAVNGMLGTTVSVTAVNNTTGMSYDLGQDLAEGADGAPAMVDPGAYTATFNDGSADIATYDFNIGGVQVWTVVSGYGDNGAYAYSVLPNLTLPAVVFENSASVAVDVQPGVGELDPGVQMGNYEPALYTLTTTGGASVDADVTGVPDTSYTDLIAVGDDTTILSAVVTIDDLAALLASLEPGTSQVAVPDVVGQTEADATTAITGAGLVAAATAVPSDTVPEGSVISQAPDAGAMVDAGTNVNIDVSTGPDAPDTVPVPDVAGKAAADAQAELEAAGFTVVTEEQPSMDVEAGLVIETNPSAGTEVATGETVTMIVSSGAGEIIVPNFVGMNQDDATKAAEDAGLTITFVEDPENPDPEGIVASQEPVAGSKVEEGSEVVAQLAPKLDDAWVILTLNPNRLLTASGINFLPGSTVDLTVVDADKGATATVQSNGSWVTTADLSDVQNDAEHLLVVGTAADGSAYEATFKIPAAGESTDEPTDQVPVEIEEESSGVSVWVWIVLGLLVVAIVLLGIKMFGGGDSTGGDDTTGGDAPTTPDSN